MRVLITLLLVPALSFGASKEIVELQRDVALLQDNVRTLQRTMDEKFTTMNVLLQQSVDNINRVNSAVSQLQGSIGSEVTRQTQVVGSSVANLGGKVDQLSTDMGALRETLADLSNTIKKMQAQVTDIANTKTPIPPPPTTTTGTSPNGGMASGSTPAGPPPGLKALDLYNAALADHRSGKDDLAQQEFSDYLSFFGTTDLAANAQYYLGEIGYNKQDYNGALNNFNLVLDKYPENPKRADAMYMVGQALLRQGQRNAAYQQFKKLAQSYPNRQDLIGKANSQIKEMGLAPLTSDSSTSAPSRSSGRKRK